MYAKQPILVGPLIHPVSAAVTGGWFPHQSFQPNCLLFSLHLLSFDFAFLLGNPLKLFKMNNPEPFYLFVLKYAFFFFWLSISIIYPTDPIWTQTQLQSV